MSLLYFNFYLSTLYNDTKFDMKSNPNTDELLELLRLRDRQGFSILYDRYSTALFGVICKIVKIEEEAENLLQDTFVKIWKNIELYNASKGSLFTWILNIARNTAIDFLRSKKHQQRSQSLSMDEYSTSKISANNHDNHEYIGVKDLVNKLDNPYRAVIDLVYFEGYTHEEAAEHLQIPLGTLKTRVRTAMRELRKWVTEDEY
jgi:RNA polymerase sigma-70 factor, ECF subfamily